MKKIPAVMVFLFSVAAAFPTGPKDACVLEGGLIPAVSGGGMEENQERDLGEAVADQLLQTRRVIDDEVTDHLRHVGQRLVDQAPPSTLKFEFYIVDYPEINAFYLLGGRVYVTRKLIAAARSEDELAAVIGHEIGHALTRKNFRNLARAIRAVLGEDLAGDRKGISEQYNRFLDNIARNPSLVRDLSRYDEEEELAADRVSVYLAGRAGYSPEAGAHFWDRSFEVRGRTGGALSDFFGTTKPEQRRLREMKKMAAQFPPSCVGTKPETTQQQFEEWKSAVADYSGLGRRESLSNLKWKRMLQPHLRGNIEHMLFSRDGHYVLAQDASSIFVLSRDPFEVLFRIDAQNAFAAQFTPDSSSIVFHTDHLRVETWSISEEKRTALREMTVVKHCLWSKLSPDARHIACVAPDFTLTLFNVSDENRLYQKKFGAFLGVLSYIFLRGSPFQIEFSPDGRYLVASNTIGGEYCAFDFSTGRALKLPRSIENLLGRSFAFMSGDRFVGSAGQKGEKSAVVRFPSGEVIFRFQSGAAAITPATQGDYLILRPIDKFPAGVLDLSQNKITMASKQSALDLYGGCFISERVDGVAFLFQIGKETALARTALPKSPLPMMRLVEISDDMRWLAISGKSRGAIWDLQDGARVFYSRNFQGAHFTKDNVLLVDFPKAGEDPRFIARIHPGQAQVSRLYSLNDEDHRRMVGSFLVATNNSSGRGKDRAEAGIVVSEVASGEKIWARPYPKGIPQTVGFNTQDDKIILVWKAASDFVKEEGKGDPELKKRIESKKEKEGDYYIQIGQSSTGRLLGKAYIETGMGSFDLRWVDAAGNYLFMADTQNRLLIYSIADGKRLGQVFAGDGFVSPRGDLLAAESESGIVTLYSLPAIEKCGQLTFSDPVAHMQFSSDGKQLFVLTSGQTAYLFDTANWSPSAHVQKR